MVGGSRPVQVAEPFGEVLHAAERARLGLGRARKDLLTRSRSSRVALRKTVIEVAKIVEGKRARSWEDAAAEQVRGIDPRLAEDQPQAVVGRPQACIGSRLCPM